MVMLCRLVFRFADGRHFLQAGQAVAAGGECRFAARCADGHQGDNLTNGNDALPAQQKHTGQAPLFLEFRRYQAEIFLDVAAGLILDMAGDSFFDALCFGNGKMKEHRAGGIFAQQVIDLAGIDRFV